MNRLTDLSVADLRDIHTKAQKEFEEFKGRGLDLNMTRGKPAPEQLELSNELLRLPGNSDWYQEDGGDTRNYYGSIQGLPEARALFSSMLGASPDQTLIGNNSSLALMHDCITFALLKSVPDGDAPWGKQEPISFLCPTPGYDRHFAICEAYGIKMIPVAMTGEGPDMDEVERLVADPSVKGMWCVPKYSNPTGESYSAVVIERLAIMKTGAADFRLFWDNAYGVHHLTDDNVEIINILEACERAGHANRPLVFASTSKITFAGGGLALFASSAANMRWLTDRMSKRTIGPEKLNQLRHVRFLKNAEGIAQLMLRHRKIVAPKFAAVHAAFERRLAGTGAATWTTPKGGYFISIDVLDGCAARVVALAKEGGIALVPAGAAFPYGRDPRDRHLRIAPTFPSLAEVTAAADGIALSVLLASTEALLNRRSRTVQEVQAVEA